MPEHDDALLDLSTWPAPPPRAPEQRPPVVLRTRPRRRLPWRVASLVALGLGACLLLLPLPGCGPALAAQLRHTTPVPHRSAPQLDDAQVAADAEAVRRAEAALAAWHPPRAAPVASPRPTATATAQQEVTAAQHEVDTDEAELDALLSEQEESDDPAAYDDDVAAARARLDAAEARLDRAQRALAAARATHVPSHRRTTAVARTPPAALRDAVVEARRVQAAHLAARRDKLSTWRAALRAETSRVQAHNASVRGCARRSAVPAWGGAALLVAGCAALLRHRLTS